MNELLFKILFTVVRIKIFMEEEFICLRMIISILVEDFSFYWIYSYVSIQTQIIINLFVTKMQGFKKCHMHSFL